MRQRNFLLFCSCLSLGMDTWTKFTKKVVVRFVKTSRLRLAEVTKRWPFESPETAISLWRITSCSCVLLGNRLAASGLSNGHLFVTSARQNREIFTNRTTTFFANLIQMSVPSEFQSKEINAVLFPPSRTEDPDSAWIWGPGGDCGEVFRGENLFGFFRKM